jgi:hypothetical protein
MNLIKSFSGVAVSFNQDGYLNASAIAKHFGKRVPDFLKTEQNQEYISALAEYLSKTKKIVLEENQLVIVKHGGNQSGTWLHPKLAIHFARWLDPRFAVWCDEQIEHILSGSLKLETRDVALSAQDVRRLSALFCHLPFMLAYAKETQTAVCSLKPELVFRTHDRFQDGYIAARQLADSLGLPMRSWRDVQLDMFR